MKNPLVSIIIPTLNSANNLNNLFISLEKSTYKDFDLIINDDLRTSDATKKVILSFKKKGLRINYIQKNTSMAQGRKEGAKQALGGVYMHLDSDMTVSKGLIGECVKLIEIGFSAVVITEESYGNTFWARCKWLEKKCYEGVEQIESLRVVKADIYKKLGGHNVKMVFSEDKDFDIRVREAGFKIGRTKNVIYHNEGNLSLMYLLKKRLFYAKTANVFAKEHPSYFSWQSNVLNRYTLYLKNYKYFLRYPILYIGMLFMKTSEFIAGGLGYLF